MIIKLFPENEKELETLIQTKGRPEYRNNRGDLRKLAVTQAPV